MAKMEMPLRIKARLFALTAIAVLGFAVLPPSAAQAVPPADTPPSTGLYDQAYRTTDSLTVGVHGESGYNIADTDITSNWAHYITDKSTWYNPTYNDDADTSLLAALDHGRVVVSEWFQYEASRDHGGVLVKFVQVSWTEDDSLALTWQSQNGYEAVNQLSGDNMRQITIGNRGWVFGGNDPTPTAWGYAHGGGTVSNNVTGCDATTDVNHGSCFYNFFANTIHPNYPYKGLSVRTQEPGGVDLTICKTLYYLAVRGSSEDPQGAAAKSSGAIYPSGVVNDGMGNVLKPQYETLKRLLAALPAPFVTPKLGGGGIVYDAIPVSAGDSYSVDYGKSISVGAQSLRDELAKINADCGSQGTKIALTGYSQGADVINRVMAQVQQQHSDDLKNVVAIVYYGNPSRLAPQNDVVSEMESDSGKGIDRDQGYPMAVDSATDEWINTHSGKGILGKVVSFCTALDIVCDTSTNTDEALRHPNDAAAYTGYGVFVHTHYQTHLLQSCPAVMQPGNIREMVAPDCGAAIILNGLGYQVPSGFFPAPPIDLNPIKSHSTVVGVVNGAQANMLHTGFVESTPVYVGSFVTDKNGVGVLKFTLPSNLADGEHHLKIVSVTGRTYSVSFTVSNSAPGTTQAFIGVDGKDSLTNPAPPPSNGPGAGCTGSLCLGTGLGIN